MRKARERYEMDNGTYVGAYVIYHNQVYLVDDYIPESNIYVLIDPDNWDDTVFCGADDFILY